MKADFASNSSVFDADLLLLSRYVTENAFLKGIVYSHRSFIEHSSIESGSEEKNPVC